MMTMWPKPPLDKPNLGIGKSPSWNSTRALFGKETPFDSTAESGSTAPKLHLRE